MIESKYCKCGEPINVEHGAKYTCRNDGKRFYHPADKRPNICLYRCTNCCKVIKYDELIELGELPIDIYLAQDENMPDEKEIV